MPKRIYHRFSAPFAAATLVFAAILSVIFTIAYCVNLVSPNSQTVGAGMSSSTSNRGYTNPFIEAVNAKADRERYYALLREKAQSRADKFVAKANKNERFKELTKELSKMEIALAKAEVFEPKDLPALTEQKAALLRERRSILESLGIEEAELVPQFVCGKCSDTGFLPSGVACNCYKPN